MEKRESESKTAVATKSENGKRREYRAGEFEGPLDLLWALIRESKVNIYDIPIAQITEQYLDYLDYAVKTDLGDLSEFYSWAAKLIHIKSRMLLPVEVAYEDDDDEDPRQELVEKLLEYKMYKYMSFELRDRELDGEKTMCKMATIPKEVMEYVEPVDLDLLLEDVTLQRLNMIFKDVMKRRVDKIDPVRSKFGKLEKEEVTLDEKLEYVINYLKQNHKFSFRQLLTKQSSKTQIVVTFLAVLQLMKEGMIIVEQEHHFDDLYITSQI